MRQRDRARKNVARGPDRHASEQLGHSVFEFANIVFEFANILLDPVYHAVLLIEPWSEGIPDDYNEFPTRHISVGVALACDIIINPPHDFDVKFRRAPHR